MMLARLAGELRTDPDLSRRLLPVRFTEENHEIFEIGDFWADALFHLARESEWCDREISRELYSAHAEFTRRWRGEDLEYRARGTMLEAADRLGRQLVVMVENLQTLNTDGGDLFGWQLRKTLQTEPQIILVGTATSYFRNLYDASAPFYHFFRIITLEPLETEECRALWNAVSAETRSRRRIRPLEILTGGNPRLLAILAAVARHRPFEHSFEALVRLLDEHTEYFRGRLEGMARTERRVYLAAIDRWRPSTSQEIADRARLDIRTASALLGRLVDRGAVVVETVGKKRRYAAAERLWPLYYRLRRERDHAVDLRRFCRFMDVFYDAAADSAAGGGGDDGGRRAAAPSSPRVAASGGGSSAPGAPRFEGGYFTGDFPADRAPFEPMLAAEPTAPYDTRAPTEPWTRAEALYGAGRGEEADALVRRSVAEFDPEDTESLRRLVGGFVRLAAGGAPAGALLDLLGGDEGRAAAVLPLMVALGRLAGREVRAPAEALEVADDLGRDLEEERRRRERVGLASGTEEAPRAAAGSGIAGGGPPRAGEEVARAGGDAPSADDPPVAGTLSG